MKKLYTIFLAAAATLSLSVTAKAYEPISDIKASSMTFRLNFKDWATGEPLPGVLMGINFHGSANDFIVDGTDYSQHKDYSGVLMTGSGLDGSSHYTTTWTNDGLKRIYVTASNGHFLSINMPKTYFFDMDPLTAGFGWDTSVPEKVRNVIDTYNMNELQTPGGWDNTSLTAEGLAGAGAAVIFDVYLKDTRSSHDVYIDITEIANAAQYGTRQVATDGVIGALPDPESKIEGVVFDHWEFYNGGAIDLETYQVKHNIAIKPVWKTSGPREGKIHFKVFMWDHEKYNANQKTWYCQNYSLEQTGKNGSKVMCNYYMSEYSTNAGWTNIPISGLRFTFRTYKDQAGLPVDPLQLGEITTDINGEATYVLDNDQMNTLTAGFAIDADPDPTCLGSLVRDPEYGREYCVFDYDWMSFSPAQNAGLIGVRYIPEGTRHDDLGIQLGNHNDNDAMLITNKDKYAGFEFTFVCYVLPAPCAIFDINGGTGLAESNIFPIQKNTPLNSAGVPVPTWTVVDPGTPTPPAGYEFEGWHEVRTTLLGAEYIDPNPYVFPKNITRSIVLRAIYGKVTPKYTVRWAPDTWTGAPDTDLYEMTKTYKDGDLPTYNQDLPTKVGGKFQGWDVYVKDDSGSKSFGELGNYRFVKTLKQPKSDSDTGDDFMKKVEAILSTFWESKVAIDGADQIYVAKFNIFQTITVVKTGLKTGDSAIFTLTDGTDTRKIVLTGKGDEPVSKTVIVGTGDWTVTEETSWSWAYETASVSQDVTVNEGEQKTVTFANSSKNTTPSHDESSVNNVFSK